MSRNRRDDQGQSAGRSAEQRERDRLEREARRAAAAQGSPPPTSSDHSNSLAPTDFDAPPPSPIDEPPRRGRRLASGEAPAERPARRTPAGEPPPDLEPRVDRAADRRAARRLPPGDRKPRGVLRIQPEPPAPPAAPAGALDDDLERPIGIRRVRRVVAPRSPRAIVTPPGDVPAGPARARRSVGSRVAVLIGLMLLAAVLVVVLMVFQPFGSAQGDAVRVTIAQGSSAREIGDQLAEAGVVSSGALFSLRAALAGKRADLRSGPHRLRKDMTYGAAIEALSKRPTVDATATIKVTIPEGLSRSEIAKLVSKKDVTGSYASASKRFSGRLNPFRYGAPKGTRSTEGFLFPATYELRTAAPAKDLVDRQLKAFKDNFDSVDLKRARRKNLTAYDVLIIASMVEREAQLASERKLVAAVIYNRLKDGIPLQIDATSRYALQQLDAPAQGLGPRERLPVQHAQADGPAADADRQSRPGLDPRRRRAGERELPLLRRQAGHVRQARLLVELREVPGRQPALQHRAQRGGRQVTDDVLEDRRYGVLGWPVGHSRSPAMMQAAGLERYQRLPVAPQAFDDTVRALGASGFAGANVTIPHKEAALALATTASDAARAIGAANTLTFGEDGEIAAENTDAPGFMAALGHVPRTACVLGAGGSARAVVWALMQAGTDVSVYNRTAARARKARCARRRGARRSRRPRQLHERRAGQFVQSIQGISASGRCARGVRDGRRLGLQGRRNGADRRGSEAGSERHRRSRDPRAPRRAELHALDGRARAA